MRTLGIGGRMKKRILAAVLLVGLLASGGYAAELYEVTVTQWGLPGDVPLVGDFNGDKVPDLVIWRPWTGVWYIRSGNQAATDPLAFTWFSYQWGLSGDVPIIADMNSDGRADFVIYRPSNGTWYTQHNDFFPRWLVE